MISADFPPVHVTVAGSPEDPRSDVAPEGVVVHRVPALHPDDVTVVRGIPCTSVARTLIDLAEDLSPLDLRAAFGSAQRQGLLDLEAVRASRGRVEWRPSLAMLDLVIDEFSA